MFMTSTVASATANTPLLATLGSTIMNYRVQYLWAAALTAAANQQISFRSNTNGSNAFLSIITTTSTPISITIPNGGWVIDTDTAFYVNLNTAGAVAVTVGYDLERKST